MFHEAVHCSGPERHLARHDDGRDPRMARMYLHDRFHPAFLGHHDIHNHQINRGLVDIAQCLVPAFCLHNRVAFAGEEPGSVAAYGGIIVNYQYVCHK